MAEPIEAVWTALQALPKPVSYDQALTCANDVLATQGLGNQFAEWFKTNGTTVLRRLNG